jgi:hypothetical protein
MASAAREAGESEADVARSTASRLSGPDGLTAQHNTFARRHALAEIAGEFVQGARVDKVERAASAYLAHGTVVYLGRVGDERRFTTRDLLACGQETVEGAERRASEGCGVPHPGLPDLVLAGSPIS